MTDVTITTEQQRSGVLLALRMLFDAGAVDPDGRALVAPDDHTSPAALRLDRIDALVGVTETAQLPHCVAGDAVELLREAVRDTDPREVAGPGYPDAVTEHDAARSLVG
jgi:hypothetical protein